MKLTDQELTRLEAELTQRLEGQGTETMGTANLLAILSLHHQAHATAAQERTAAALERCADALECQTTQNAPPTLRSNQP